MVFGGRRFLVDILTLVAVALGQIFGFFSKGDLGAPGLVLFWWIWLVFFGFAPIFRALEFFLLRDGSAADSGANFRRKEELCSQLRRESMDLAEHFVVAAGPKGLPSSPPHERRGSESLPHH